MAGAVRRGGTTSSSEDTRLSDRRAHDVRAVLLVLVGLALAGLAAPITPYASPAENSPAPPAEIASSEPVVRWQPPSGLVVQDAPNDDGHGLLLTWTLSPDDAQVLVYEIERVPAGGAGAGPAIPVGTAPRGTATFTYQDKDASLKDAPNPKYVASGVATSLRVRARSADGSVSPWTAPATGSSHGNWFDRRKVNELLGVLIFGGAVFGFIEAARRGMPLYIRPIPGVSAVDEAIGRATEMGRPILFVSGTGTAGDIASIAAFTILARIAKRTADYQTPLRVPVNDPVMMAVAQEVVREAYLQAGRPEAYRPETVFYISAMQFPYVAAVNGLMLREKTATNFYMGVFHAESLLLAESGSATGAIQISGTDQVSQIPFFVAATDYTLIGEELYAASASLSQDPKLMGPLKAQDYAKVVLIAALVISVGLLTFFNSDFIVRLFQTPS